MKGYLLDTNICIFAFRGQYDIPHLLRDVGNTNCYVSDITVLELRYGAYKSSRPEENLALIDNFLQCVTVIPFAKSIDIFCQEKLRLQQQGSPIEDFDLIIGCTAKVTGLKLVTDNVRHMERIEGITIENWVNR